MKQLQSYLAELHGRIIYYKPNPGNGGDALIAYATLRQFERWGIEYRLVDDDMDLSNQIVVYGGGGNLVGYYQTAANFIRRWHNQVAELIILPHTIAAHEELLSSLSSNVTIFCREQASYSYVKGFANIGRVYLADDMVLGLQESDYQHKLKPYPRLAQAAKYKSVFSRIWKRKRSVKFFFMRRDNAEVLNAFREDAEATTIKIPQDNVDVTALINLDKTMCDIRLVEDTVHRLLGFINYFKTVKTNRLHVCIAAALLGKQVEFYDNSYHKNKNVYEHSIRHKFANVKWMG